MKNLSANRKRGVFRIAPGPVANAAVRQMEVYDMDIREFSELEKTKRIDPELTKDVEPGVEADAELVCDLCGRIETLPYDDGDACYCSGKFRTA